MAETPTDPPQPASGPASPEVELLVCATCRREGLSDEPRPGARLHAALEGGALPDGVTLRPVECLSNCTRGCTIVLRAPGRWTFVYGNIDPDETLAAVAEGVARYRDAPDGLVPWRQRPEHFRKNCIARIPPILSAEPEETIPCLT